jgi:hypothetical protein
MMIAAEWLLPVRSPFQRQFACIEVEHNLP